MSTRQAKQGSGGNSRKKGKSKRKAKSPLLDTGQTGTSSCKHPRNVYSHDNSIDNSGSFIAPNMSTQDLPQPHQSNQYHMATPQPQGNYMTCNNPPVYNQGNYPTHSAQSPGFIPQQLQMMSSPQTGPPPWAQQLIKDMSELKTCISKIDNIEKTVNVINLKVSDLESKVNDLERKVVETENSCVFISKENDDQKQALKGATSDITKMKNLVSNLEDTVSKLEKQNIELDSKVIDQEIRSMRDNLIFYGIKEDQQNENCENLVKTMCSDYLNFDASTLSFDRVHRLGQRSTGKPRPIVAKFHYYKEREDVRNKGFANADTLKRNGLGIGAQWPKQVRDARRLLMPIMEREKNKGNSVKFVRDKLFVNGRQYTDDK